MRLAFDPMLAFYAVPLVVVWPVYLGAGKKGGSAQSLDAGGSEGSRV